MDDLKTVVTPHGLAGGFGAVRKILETIENDIVPVSVVLGEPQMGKRGLYPTISKSKSSSEVRSLMNVLSQCDGCKSVLEIAEKCELASWEVKPIIDTLLLHNLVKIIDQKNLM